LIGGINVKVKILKQCGIRGKTAKVGDVVEVSELDGRYLIGTGTAEETKPAKIKVNKK
jgi:hypothetical protein